MNIRNALSGIASAKVWLFIVTAKCFAVFFLMHSQKSDILWLVQCSTAKLCAGDGGCNGYIEAVGPGFGLLI